MSYKIKYESRLWNVLYQVVQLKDEALHYNKQGLQLLHADKLVEAIEFFTKAIEVDPDCAEAYLNRGETYQLMNRIVEGNTDIQKAKDLKSGKLRNSRRSGIGPVQKLDMKNIDSIYDSVFPGDAEDDDNALDFEDDLYDYVFSDDSIDDDTAWENLIHDNTETIGFPAILEHHGGEREEVSGVLFFQPTQNELTITESDGNTTRTVPVEQFCCIRTAGLPPEIIKTNDASCHIEIIETLDGNLFYECIHPEQEVDNLLIGFSTKADTRFKYTLIPKINIKKRCQQRYLGDILLEKRFIASDILKSALEEHQQMKNMKLGKIIAQRANILYSAVENEILNAYNNNIRGLKTGEILLAAGLVDEEQILDAIEYQETIQKQKIGQFLIEKGIIQEHEVFNALAEKFRIPFVDLRKQKVSKKILSLLPREFVMQHKVMPITFNDGELTLATLNPDTSTLCEIVLKQTKCKKVHFVLTQPTHLKNVINILYQDARQKKATDRRRKDRRKG